MPDLDDQQLWRACIGLDLADRTVLEAEVLIWRIVRQKSATLMRQSLDPGEGDSLHLTNRSRKISLLSPPISEPRPIQQASSREAE